MFVDVMLRYMPDIAAESVGVLLWLEVRAQAMAKTATKPRTPMLMPAPLAPLLGAGGMPEELDGVTVARVGVAVETLV